MGHSNRELEVGRGEAMKSFICNEKNFEMEEEFDRKPMRSQSKFTTGIQKTGKKILYKLKGAEKREWKSRRKGVVIVKTRSNKNMNGCFKSDSKKMGVEMPKVGKMMTCSQIE